MSEQNVELLRRWLTAFNARDLDAVLALSDPKVEFHSVFAAVGGAVYRGHEGMRKWHRDLEDAWGATIRVEPEAYFDLGEHTLLSYVFRGRGRESGAEVAMPATSIARWRDGRVTYVNIYMQRDDALRELGVSEEELEPITP